MTASAPNTVGRELTSARRLLRNADWQVEVEQSGPPPPHQVPAGPLRVIQQRRVGQDAVTLIVARQISLGCCEGDRTGLGNGF